MSVGGWVWSGREGHLGLNPLRNWHLSGGWCASGRVGEGWVFGHGCAAADTAAVTQVYIHFNVDMCFICEAAGQAGEAV